MFRKLLLLLLAPCAAPAAALVAADGQQEPVTPRAEVVEKSEEAAFEGFRKRYISPVAQVIRGLRESLSPPVVIELEEEQSEPFLIGLSEPPSVFPLAQKRDCCVHPPALDIVRFTRREFSSSVRLLL